MPMSIFPCGAFLVKPATAKSGVSPAHFLAKPASFTSLRSRTGVVTLMADLDARLSG